VSATTATLLEADIVTAAGGSSENLSEERKVLRRNKVQGEESPQERKAPRSKELWGESSWERGAPQRTSGPQLA
jgi:hypothetical protein